MTTTPSRLSAALAEQITAGREHLRDLRALAAQHGQLDQSDDWGYVAGTAWALLEDSRDLITLNRDGELDAVDVDRWLGEIEDLANDAARLPRYDD